MSKCPVYDVAAYFWVFVFYGGDFCRLTQLLNAVVKAQLPFPRVRSCEVCDVIDNQDADRSYNTNDCKINVKESTVSSKHGIVDLIVCSGRGWTWDLILTG